MPQCGQTKPFGQRTRRMYLPTRLIVSEPLVDLLERARVIDTGYGMRVTVHPRQIAPRLRSVKGIPTLEEITKTFDWSAFDVKAYSPGSGPTKCSDKGHPGC